MTFFNTLYTHAKIMRMRMNICFVVKLNVPFAGGSGRLVVDVIDKGRIVRRRGRGGVGGGCTSRLWRLGVALDELCPVVLVHAVVAQAQKQRGSNLKALLSFFTINF